MAIKFDWLVENRVVYVQYVDVVTVEELTTEIGNIVELIGNSSAPLVHTLIDTTELVDYPKDISTILKSTKQVLVHPKFGWMLVYGQDDRLMQFFVQVVTSMLKVRMRIFKKRDDAVAFLKYVDTSLEDILE